MLGKKGWRCHVISICEDILRDLEIYTFDRSQFGSLVEDGKLGGRKHLMWTDRPWPGA